MNDRYLFRGKRIDNGEWLEGGVYHQLKDDVKDEKLYIIGGSLNDVGCAYEVIPETVGQCTGLKDKNGKLIFEGDIVNFDTIGGYFTKCVLEYVDYFTRICAVRNDCEYPLCERFGYEIIGNIHDNPELLEVD